MVGKVTLVSAGPGNIDLLTIKGYNAIQNADIVIYDRLIGKDIINIIPENVEKIDAGKKSSFHKIPQNKINKLLLDNALLGKNVVRLKGGDCFLFGRGGEELELLEKNNIPFEVVPGITSALSVPAYAGIPITHRDFSSSVHIVSGHRKENQPLKINFENLVKSEGTIIFLMGLSSIGDIMNGLIVNGMKKSTQCAVIECGTLPSQRKIISDIASIQKMCETENIQSPVIIVVGEVCGFSQKFDWFDKLPLKGKSIVVTRPKDRNNEICCKLKSLGADVIEYPCIKTISLINDSFVYDILHKIKLYDYIVFTSPVGVKLLFEKLFEKDFDSRIFADKKIAVIGSATKKELLNYGIIADFIPKNYNGDSLGDLLAENAKGKKVLLLRAKNGTYEIINKLKNNNIEFEDISIYHTIYTSDNNKEIIKKINDNNIDYVTFTSSSTVESFVSYIKPPYDNFTGICIGDKTNVKALEYGIKTIVSKNASVDDMISAILSEVSKCH